MRIWCVATQLELSSAKEYRAELSCTKEQSHTLGVVNKFLSIYAQDDSVSRLLQSLATALGDSAHWQAG